MPHLVRRWRLGLMLVFALANAATVFAFARRPNGPVPFPVETTHPYAKAMDAFNRLAPEDRDAVGSAKPDSDLSPAVLEARREIAAALAQGRDASPQWQAEHDPLLPGYDPGFFQTLSSLAAARSAAVRSDDEPGAADAALLDGLALHLGVGPGLSVHDWTQQQEFITSAIEQLQSRATEFSPTEAAALLAELQALPPPVAFADMLGADPLWKTPGTKLRRALERKARAMGFKSDRIDPGELRMAGMVAEPDRVAVSFETPSGSFWLETGQNRYGVALLEIDLPGRHARIRFEGREAIVELRSRQIESWDDAVLESAVKSLIEESDIVTGSLLERRDKSSRLSDHLARLDAFGREVEALMREISESVIGESEPEALTTRLARLEALAPLPSFKGRDLLQAIQEARAQGEAIEAKWRKTEATLKRIAGGAMEAS